MLYQTNEGFFLAAKKFILSDETEVYANNEKEVFLPEGVTITSMEDVEISPEQKERLEEVQNYKEHLSLDEVRDYVLRKVQPKNPYFALAKKELEVLSLQLALAEQDMKAQEVKEELLNTQLAIAELHGKLAE